MHRTISRQENITYSSPDGLTPDSLPPPQRVYGRTYADVITKISRIDSLPNLLSDGAPLARGYAHTRSAAIIFLTGRLRHN